MKNQHHFTMGNHVSKARCFNTFFSTLTKTKENFIQNFRTKNALIYKYTPPAMTKDRPATGLLTQLAPKKKRGKRKTEHDDSVLIKRSHFTKLITGTVVTR